MLKEFVQEEDDTTSNFVPSSQSKPRGRQRKSSTSTRQIQHVWLDDEINRLISSVEQHPGLWDISSAEYKLPKLDGWRSVADELRIDGVDVNEAKAKWLQLRTTFMVNFRKKKSGQGANESKAVKWKFFKSMMFLEAISLKHSKSSTSTLHLESAAIDSFIVDEFSDPSQASTSEVAVGNRRKRQCTKTPTPSPSPSSFAGSSSAQAISYLNGALHSSDTNSTFCDNLLAELRTLPESKARTLRYKISRLMMDFMEACHADPP